MPAYSLPKARSLLRSCERASSGCLILTVPLAANLGPEMLKRPTLDFSARAPGTGADISFSEYVAFALLNALRIVGHGWPQGFAVSVSRRELADLEPKHARILKQDPVKLFDQQAIRANARDGDIAVTNIASKAEGAQDERETPLPLSTGDWRGEPIQS